jgi:hypothetical protein
VLARGGANDFNLSISRYVDTTKHEEVISVKEGAGPAA